MTTILIYLTALCFIMPIYVYLGYPIILFLLSKLIKEKRVNKKACEPTVTLVISCYNEANVIKEKIENSLRLDYPKNRLEIIFVSDGSDDGTDGIISEYTGPYLKLVRQEGRLGKTSALNMAVPLAHGEIIVFSDANAMYKTDVIRTLVQSFNDPSIGYVVGAALYTDSEESSAASSENAYWQYEMYIKKLETRLHSVVGGDGAIYAIRHALYETLDAKDINDFVNPLQIIAKGYRGVFEPGAICYEETAGDFQKEAQRKERIVNRSFRGLMKVKSVLNPFKVGFFSFEVISHKLLRWLIPFFVLGFTLGAIYLSISGVLIFQIILTAEILFLWLSTIGYFLSRKKNIPSVFSMPYYFIAINFSAMLGVLHALRGNIQVTWSSPRGNANRIEAKKGKQRLSILVVLLISVYLLFDAVNAIYSVLIT